MSKYSLFMCDKCDFTYEHVDRIFYLNEDLTEITEDTLRIMTLIFLYLFQPEGKKRPGAPAPMSLS